MDSLPLTAGSIVKQRLINYVEDKLESVIDDTSSWEFYAYLLEQAKKHSVDYSGYAPLAYQADRDEAIKNCKSLNSNS